MRRAFLHFLVSTGLILSLFVGLTGAVVAQEEEPEEPDISGSFENVGAFLPWVPNGVAISGSDEFDGSVTVQNIEHLPIEVDIYVGLGLPWDDEAGEEGFRDWGYSQTIHLEANESMTLDAETLGIPEGMGASVALVGYFVELPLEALEAVIPDEFEDELIEEIAWPARIAAVAKSASPAPMDSAMTSEDHAVVDGYSALTLDQIYSEDGTFVLPIVQNNSGWETVLRIAHLGEFFDFGDSLTNVTVTLYGSGEQGYAGQSQVINLQLRPGGVTSVNLSEYVPEGWVGSAFITSNAPIGAVAERYKAETDMLVTNVSRPETQDSNTQFAPLVFKEYNFWNTGIAVANTDPSRSNSVTVTYYGPTMNQVGQDTLTIPPRGMEFIYTPGAQDLGLGEGFVGSARISGTTTFHAAIDQVKYQGDDPDVGQAMSYVLEHNIGQFHDLDEAEIPDLVDDFGAGDTLALPLAQKGNPNTGSGDTSGIQLFNTSLSNSIRVAVTFYGANGLPVAPTVDNNEANPILVTLGPSQSYTLYAHELDEMSAGFQGSATVEVVGGDGGVVGVSNNVNYDVAGDGSAAFNLVNVMPIYEIIDQIVCGYAPEACESQAE